MKKACGNCKFWIKDPETASKVPLDNYRCYSPKHTSQLGLAGPSLTGHQYVCNFWEKKELDHCEKCGLKICMCLPPGYIKPVNPSRKMGYIKRANPSMGDDFKEETKITQETPFKVLGNVMINGKLVTEEDVLYALEKIGIDTVAFQSRFADFLGILEEKMK